MPDHQIPKQRIAIVRLKGDGHMHRDVRNTFRLLRLYRKQHCAIIPNTPEYVGMLKVIKDAATWGEINQETFKLLLLKRGKVARKEKFTESYLKEKTKMDAEQFVKEFFAFSKELKDVPGLKPFFKLSPPRKGLEKKGVKAPYSLGGALGYRKDDINDLIQRMA
ncbi:MAG TPA: 50S ribosomal protein L30 [Candidatus Nanoarchaeia archaeon]|nr:50S ribosomal protein L30 [Candidatus Nanoarchaeia archaeon]